MFYDGVTLNLRQVLFFRECSFYCDGLQVFLSEFQSLVSKLHFASDRFALFHLVQKTYSNVACSLFQFKLLKIQTKNEVHKIKQNKILGEYDKI